ncbi:urate hydroxylase PuuD (plasmid) [Paroceanicella profunda]|uniref:Urate hydroxylase PuuD n=1 Tax=Paroceanicella profunda TaxID=2579971 RepID=A0A5B8G5A1_9RHOB|nr:urate hydroxylase PuuD [Paroceanicella profunda]QDL94143.1 urate hydroxylase PuuD [Paroceanicella profunda]
MEAVFHDWISLFVRWAHIIAAIGWIGSSFYFMGLDYSLRKRKGMEDDKVGDTWQVHGGGFYHMVKYKVAPEHMPEELTWFKWESYSTWMTGFAMMAVTYYWGAKGLLIDRSVADLPVPVAILLSAGSLVAGWFLYDGLCKSALRHRPAVMFAVLYVALVFAAWAFGQVFSARAAWLHIGAVIATMMSGNVFLVIIPNQRIVVEDLKAGRAPEAKYGQIAKLRSTHNNYLTLPVVLMMVSNHYPMAFGHPYSWVLIGFILVIGAVVRHWFNMHEQGRHGAIMKWQWPLATVLAIGMMWFSSWRPGQAAAEVAPQAAMAVVSKHCAMCHAATPTHEGFEEAPGGVAFDTLPEIRAHASKMLAQAVLSNTMPLGNETGMTPDERATLGAWLRAGAPE